MKKLYSLLRANAKNEARDPLKIVAEGDVATVYMYDVIDADYGINAIEFAKSLGTIAPNATLNLRINSPGGDVFEARAIATAIKAHAGKVVAHIDGLAASAATTIAAAADEVVIADGSFYMIHNAWTLVMGDKNDMNTTAGLLDKIDGAIRDDYMKRTGLSAEKVVEYMNAETWFSAAEAVELGFADRMADEPKTKNASTWNVSAYDNAPEILNAPAPAEEVPEYATQRAQNARRLRLLSIT